MPLFTGEGVRALCGECEAGGEDKMNKSRRELEMGQRWAPAW